MWSNSKFCYLDFALSSKFQIFLLVWTWLLTFWCGRNGFNGPFIWVCISQQVIWSSIRIQVSQSAFSSSANGWTCRMCSSLNLHKEKFMNIEIFKATGKKKLQNSQISQSTVSFKTYEAWPNVFDWPLLALHSSWQEIYA